MSHHAIGRCVAMGPRNLTVALQDHVSGQFGKLVFAPGLEIEVAVREYPLTELAARLGLASKNRAKARATVKRSSGALPRLGFLPAAISPRTCMAFFRANSGAIRSARPKGGSNVLAVHPALNKIDFGTGTNAQAKARKRIVPVKHLASIWIRQQVNGFFRQAQFGQGSSPSPQNRSKSPC